MTTLEEFRDQMNRYWESANAEATSVKDSYLTLERLQALYRKFDASEREMANKIISEWLLSKNESKRFDAQSLIKDFNIDSALDSLSQLAGRLTLSATPGAPYELKKVRAIIAYLRGRPDEPEGAG